MNILTDTATLPNWLLVVYFLAMLGLIVESGLVLLSRRRHRTQAIDDRRDLAELCLTIRQEWNRFATSIGLDEHDPTLDVADVVSALRAHAEISTRSLLLERRMVNRYAEGIAAVWDVDPAPVGGLDIDYLEQLPAAMARRSLLLTEAADLLGDYDTLTDDLAQYLPRAGRTPGLRRRIGDLRIRRWGLHWPADETTPAATVVVHPPEGEPYSVDATLGHRPDDSEPGTPIDVRPDAEQLVDGIIADVTAPAGLIVCADDDPTDTGLDRMRSTLAEIADDFTHGRIPNHTGILDLGPHDGHPTH